MPKNWLLGRSCAQCQSVSSLTTNHASLFRLTPTLMQWGLTSCAKEETSGMSQCTVSCNLPLLFLRASMLCCPKSPRRQKPFAISLQAADAFSLLTSPSNCSSVCTRAFASVSFMSLATLQFTCGSTVSSLSSTFGPTLSR